MNNKVTNTGHIVLPTATIIKAGFKAGDKFKIEHRESMILIVKIEKIEKEKKI